MAAAHPIVVHKQELARQGQINQARIRAISGKMQAPAGRSRDTAEPALVGGCDRLAGPIGLTVCAEPIAVPGQHDLVIVLPPCPDPGGNRRYRIHRQQLPGRRGLAGPSRPSPQDRSQTTRRHIPGAKKHQAATPARARSQPCRRKPGCAPCRWPARCAVLRRPEQRIARRTPHRRPSRRRPRTPPRSSAGSLSAARSRSEPG